MEGEGRHIHFGVSWDGEPDIEKDEWKVECSEGVEYFMFKTNRNYRYTVRIRRSQERIHYNGTPEDGVDVSLFTPTYEQSSESD